MKKFAPKKRYHYTRWIILFSVLAGLFFSGGEGIQLLPFSVSENKNTENASTFSDESLKSYSYSVNSSSNQRVGTASKFQKSNKRLQLNDTLLAQGWRDFIQTTCLTQEKYSHEAKYFYTFPVLNPPSDRAPPTV